MFWDGERLLGEEEAFKDGSHCGNEYTERETFGKQSEVQSSNGTEAEREAVGRGETAAKRHASCSGALQSIRKWKGEEGGRRGERYVMGDEILRSMINIAE